MNTTDAMKACALSMPSRELPDTGDICCIGAAVYGPQRCTCWEPVFDLEQQEPTRGLPVTIRPEMCHDCAFRKGSPELSDEVEREDLLGMSDQALFFCHQGIRRPLEHRHPSGITIPGVGRDYQPPIVGFRPYKADGTPADICAGYARRHGPDGYLRLLQLVEEERKEIETDA
jgi:NAD-dependent dihydropyrimidine dehydrogenase PreA subunit